MTWRLLRATGHPDRSLSAELLRCRDGLAISWPATLTEVALSWRHADRLYMVLRDRLEQTVHWRFGPGRQPMELRTLRRIADGHVRWEGARFLDLGCGTDHPFGMSVLALALGAESALAIDQQPLRDETRSARATADLVAATLIAPHRSLGEPCPPIDAICRRLHEVFDLARLQGGELFGAVRRDLRYAIGGLEDLDLPDDHFDLSHSHTVLEHVQDLPRFLDRLRRSTRPGGWSVHYVDLRDHRFYEDPARYPWWSFLRQASFDDRTRPAALRLCNRLRYRDHLRVYAEAGWEVVDVKADPPEPIPREARAQLEPQYQALSDADLETSLFSVLLRRPL
jgi:SAM-dependent methyltransferase